MSLMIWGRSILPAHKNSTLGTLHWPQGTSMEDGLDDMIVGGSGRQRAGCLYTGR